MEELKLPERFEEYSEGRKAGFLRMKAAKESGRKVAGYFCTYTPLEVLDAAGMLSVSLCGMSTKLSRQRRRFFPKTYAPLSNPAMVLPLRTSARIPIGPT